MTDAQIKARMAKALARMENAKSNRAYVTASKVWWKLCQQIKAEDEKKQVPKP